MTVQTGSFGQIVVTRLRELGETQAWLGVEVGAHLGTKALSQSAISSWVKGAFRPSPEQVFAVETVLGLDPGQLSRHMGYLPLNARPVPPSVEACIKDDVTLPKAAQRALLACLRELRKL